MSDGFTEVAGMPLVVHWRISPHFFFTWEIDFDAVVAHLPAELEPVEVRPGIALLSVGCLRYQSGHFGQGSPSFEEVVTAVHVHPDLSLDMPHPRFSFFATSVDTNSADFVRQEGETLFTPTRLIPSLQFALTDDGMGVDAFDETGPILSFRNTDPAPRHSQTEFWGQHFTNTKGLHQGIWEWDGVRYEHMKGGDAGRLYPHRHFRGLDVTRIRGCYRQMVPKPGAVVNERFYAVRPWPPS